MRILTMLGAVQTLALLVLIYLVAGREAGEGRSAPVAPRPSSAAGSQASLSSDVDAEQLRRIIREELAATGAQPAHAGPGGAGLPPVPVDPARAQLQRDRVARQLDDYRRIGQITPVQMRALQEDIARLDPAARTAALRQLTRALNTGQIDGRF